MTFSKDGLVQGAKNLRLLEKDYLLHRDERFYIDARKLSQDIADQIELMTALANAPSDHDLISQARNAAIAYRESFDAWRT